MRPVIWETYKCTAHNGQNHSNNKVFHFEIG